MTMIITAVAAVLVMPVGMRPRARTLRRLMLADMTLRAIRRRRMRIRMRLIRGITIRTRRFILAGITGAGIGGELRFVAETPRKRLGQDL